MRAALLPTPGDPHMLAYWLGNFATWRNEVDELLVLVNGGPDVTDIVRNAGGKAAYTPHRIGHDGAIRWLLENTRAEHVVLCEDDAYVRAPFVVDEAFRRIEDGQTDLIGSPRHEDYASSPLQEWGDYTPGDLAELRHGLWPAFLFARTEDLLNTDRLYGDRRWHLGDTITDWGEVTPEACEFVGIDPSYVHLDTLFGTTFQLRAAGLRTELVHRVRLFDAEAVDTWTPGPWFHVTGLSTLDQYQAGGTLPDWDDNGGLWTRRVAWWRRTGIDVAGVPEAELARWTERFDRWVNWKEVRS